MRSSWRVGGPWRRVVAATLSDVLHVHSCSSYFASSCLCLPTKQLLAPPALP